MIGLMMLAAVAAYVGIAWFVVNRLPGKTAKWVAVAIFVLVPMWDEIAGQTYFYSQCAIEGGQRIYKTVEIGKELYGPTVPKAKLPEGQEWEAGKEYTLHVGGDHPTVKRTVLFVPDPEKLKDRYEILVAKFSNQKVMGVQRISSIVRDRQAGEILGTATSFAYWGGWVVNHSGLHVTANECPEVKMDPYEPGIHSTLLDRVFKLE